MVDSFYSWIFSAAEKTTRAAQRTFDFGLIVFGVFLTACSALVLLKFRSINQVDSNTNFHDERRAEYLLWAGVFFIESKFTHFNGAVHRTKRNTRCLELPRDSKKLTAHNEETYSEWRKARPISYM